MGVSRVLWLLACFTVAQGYRMYADRIPNGEQVPHPCKPNVLWHGVGHFNVGGGGFRNQFGQDFEDAGRQWTQELCRKDSDQDGRTNGEELGDPNCVWRVGDLPTSTQGLSHPGVCDPIDSARCQQKQFHVGLFHNQQEWMEEACKSDQFDCPAIQASDVLTQTARLNLTAVPARETTYICQIFEVPDVDNDYHMIAHTPIINNSYVLHHIVIFGCEDSVDARPAFECDMLPDRKCEMIVGLWTLGMNGECFHSKAGVRMGRHGIKRFAIQLHWNNPGEIDHYMDSSGLVLHYTPNLRQYDSSVFLLGNEHFIIPPRTANTVVTSTCSPSCTRNKLNQTIYITTGTNHMHYLGRKMRVEHIRNGTVLHNITNDHIFDYDSPKTYFYEEPIAFEPGDELRTVCEYSSTYKATSTFFGESTAEEMCYAFFSFYPFQAIQNIPFCVTYGTISRCQLETYHGCVNEIEKKFYDQPIGEMEIFRNITSSCRPFGPCTVECMDAILLAQNNDPCLTSGEPWDRIVEWSLSRTDDGRTFLAAMESCEIELYKLMNPSDSIQPN